MFCTGCGAPLAPDAKFCASCGTEVAAAAPAAERRKLVSVLFADIAGSTAMGEALDPEAIRSLLRRHFAAIRKVIEGHGGTVEKFIGDAVMAVFGIPQTHEDDALRAVRAALDLQKAINELNSIGGAAVVVMRVGVNTGEVVAGEEGDGETLVTGDTVNTAARLEQAAEPGSILIGEETFRLVADAVVAQPVAPLVLKGKAEPFAAYRISSVQAAEGRRRHLEARLVGRHQEMEQLRDAWRRVKAEESPRLVSMLAPAGVGKSRLVRELVTEIQRSSPVLMARCLPYGDGITYWPIRGLILAAAGIDDSDPVDVARDKIVAMLKDAPHTSKVAELVSAAVGLAEISAGQDEVFWAVRQAFDAIASEPTLIVVEDLHWAEPTLLDLLQYLVDLSSAPMLILANARPELLESRPEWAAMGERTSLLRLDALAANDSGELLAGQAGGEALPDDLRDRILAAAEGNPLFIEEMVAMLREDGLLVEGDDGWQAAGEGVRNVEVPSSIRALLSARLDRLPKDQRVAAERASVVGRTFEAAAVAELVPASLRSELGRHLLALVRKELLRPDSSDLVPGDAFRFRHVLIRDAAYEMLPKAERALLHERFAKWLESAAGDRLMEFEEILGYHLEQAAGYRRDLGQVDEAESLATLAGGHLMAAGARAHRRGDNSAVIPLMTKSADLLRGEPRDLALLALSIALSGSGEYSRAIEILGAVAENARSRGDRLTELRTQVGLAVLRVGDPEFPVDGLKAQLRAAIAELGTHGPDYELSHAWLALGMLSVGEVAEERFAYERAIEYGIRGEDLRIPSAAIANLCQMLLLGPTPVSEALHEIEGYSERGVGGTRTSAALKGYKGALVAMRGDFDEARLLLDEAIGVAKEIRMFGWEIVLRTELADVELLAGDPQAALDAIGPSEQLAQDMGPMRRWQLGQSIPVLVASGRPAEAKAIAEELLAEGQGDVEVVVRVLTGKAAALHATGDLPGARSAIDEAIVSLEKVQFLADLGLAYLQRALIRQDAGNGSWREDLDRARDAFDRKGHLVGIARVEALQP